MPELQIEFVSSLKKRRSRKAEQGTVLENKHKQEKKKKKEQTKGVGKEWSGRSVGGTSKQSMILLHRAGSRV